MWGRAGEASGIAGMVCQVAATREDGLQVWGGGAIGIGWVSKRGTGLVSGGRRPDDAG